MTKQELREAADVFTRLTGSQAVGEAAASKGAVLESEPDQPPEAVPGKVASREFIEKTIQAAVHPLRLQESEAERAEAADVFSRLTGSRAAGEAAASRQR
jgi:hypothetical protein